MVRSSDFRLDLEPISLNFGLFHLIVFLGCDVIIDENPGVDHPVLCEDQLRSEIPLFLRFSRVEKEGFGLWA